MLKNRREHPAAGSIDHPPAAVRLDAPTDDAPADAPADPAAGAGDHDASDAGTGPQGGSGSRAWLRALPEVGALVICAVLYAQTGAWDTTVEGPGPAFYPQLLIWLLAVAMLVRIGQHALQIRRERTGVHVERDEAMEEGAEFDGSAISIPRVWQAIALSLGYVIGTIYLGWVIATFAFVVLFLYLTGKRRLLVTVPLGAVLAVGLAFVFVRIVYIALPTGIGVFDLFTVSLLQAIGAY